MVVVAGASMLTSVWTRRTSDAILACYASLIVVLIGTLVVLPDTPLPAWLDPGSVLEQIVTCSEHWLPQFLIQGLTLGSVGAICLALAIWQLRPDKRVPSAVPYLFPDSGLVEKWRQRLPSTEEFKIGISWQGNSNHQWDRHRSFPLAEFATIARLPGLRLVSLQKGAGTEQLKAIAFEVIDFGEDLDTTSGAFMDSAAIIKNLDLVITVDSAIAHLAGALGAPVWLGLPAIVDWRWMFQREDSPWYPTMRLFRQSKLGDWASVFERMATEISKLLKPTEIGAVVAPVSPGELIDKLTILEIKSKRITDPAKLAHVRTELAWLEKTLADSIRPAPVIASLRAELKAVNEKLWEVEDEIRRYERSGDFGERFIELARSVCRENDARFALKAKINQLLNSPIAEQKEYSGFMSCAS
jgi:hypothetical protein